MVHGLKLGEALAALRKRGDVAKAEALRLRVAERFKGVLSEKELNELPVDDIVGTLNLFNELLSGQSPCFSGLQRHIDDLKNQGFTVVPGAKRSA